MNISRSRLLFVACVLLSLWVLPAAPTSGQTALVPAGSDWKYMDDGSNQGTAWREAGFDDDSWSQGQAQLGYGDGDEVTVVGYGPDPNTKYVTTYFRHSFEVDDPSQYSLLQLRLIRDDGAVVYLNGTEILRTNMPGGSIDYLTFASSTVGGGEEDAFFEYYVDSGDLNWGANLLAVEIHQRSPTSSDISFDLEVFGLEEIDHPVRKAPYLIYTGDNTEMKLLWQLTCTDTCRIEWGMDTLYSLGSESTFEHGGDHQYSYTITGLTPSATYFYRVTAEKDTTIGSFRAASAGGGTAAGFFAYGDTRTYPDVHDQVARAIMSACSTDPGLKTLLVCVGDLVSQGDEEGDWDSEFFDPSYSNIQRMLANLPYQACRGNHEGSGAGFAKYFPYPFVSPYYWSFDYGPAHFVVIDQYIDYSPGSAQYTWVANDLAATAKPWRFLVIHEPGWSAGGGHSNDSDVQDFLQPLCLEHSVSIVFAGHNHYYARADVDGVQHITTGGGGAPLHTPNVGYPNVVTAEAAYHFCQVKIEYGFLDFLAISADGDTLDRFTLTDTLTVGGEVPGPKLGLEQNVPNPFSASTSIAFTLEERGHVTLRVYDADGRLVTTLLDGTRSPNRYVEIWDGRDERGRRVPSGAYFYELESSRGRSVRKMVLIR